MEKQASGSKYWLDIVVADIIDKHPKGEIIVSSGVAPSGIYHVGHLREVLTADAVTYALKEAGREARHLHFCDDLDPFRKVPAGVPEKYNEFIGQTLNAVPDPNNCHKSYAEHYLAEFLDVIEPLKIDMEVLRSHELYEAGKFNDSIAKVTEKLDAVKKIITEVTGRKLPEDWTPIDEYPDGTTKLSWRLDWPARWALYGVQVEPFGRDHASKGGSYDSGKELVKQVFSGEAPYPVPYEFINPKGQSKKMSASAGTGLTPADVLKVMPAEILRYFILKSRPERTLQFDSGLGIYNLIEEYSQIEQAVRSNEFHEFRRAYEIASGGTKEQTISSVPFSHLVASYQAALGKPDQVSEILERTGYEAAVKDQKAVLTRELDYVKHWLAKYAPEEVKFEVQEKLPKIDLSGDQKAFLADLADGLEKEEDLTGQGIHDLVYACREKADLRPIEAFQAVYKVLLGKDSGPRAGWFLETLDRKFVLNRLRLKA